MLTSEPDPLKEEMEEVSMGSHEKLSKFKSTNKIEPEVLSRNT